MNHKIARPIACIAAMVLALALRLEPAADEFDFVHIGRTEGLSQSTVYAILQDRSGFMWFGTENGLNRFDGYDFTVFQHVPGDPSSLSHNSVLTLYEDREGILWIGTLNGGLNRYDPQLGSFRNYRHIPGRGDSLSNDIVGAIHEDRDGTFWVGTDSGLTRLDRASGRFTPQPLATDRPGKSDHIHDICEDHDGALWIGTFGGGVSRLDRRTGLSVHFRHDPADPASLGDDYVYCLHIDRQGFLWIGSPSGLYRFDRISGAFLHYPLPQQNGNDLKQPRVQVIREDRDGRLWLGTSKGLMRLDVKSGTSDVFRHDPLDAKSPAFTYIQSLHEDRSGIMWVGSSENGVCRFNQNRKLFSHLRSIPGRDNTLGNNVVVSLMEDPDGTLWIGTPRGLDKLDQKTGAITHFGYGSGPPGTLGEVIVRCQYRDREGNFWLGTDGNGLQLFDPDTGRVTVHRHDARHPGSISSDRILDICQDRTGMLWIGTYGGGLNRLDRAGGTFSHYRSSENDPSSLSDDIVRVILEDRSGSLWIGTYGGGLNRLDRRTGKFTHYRHDPANPDSLNDNYIFCLHEDREGSLWIGTLGGGLNQLEQGTEKFRHFTRADGMASNMVLGILEDHGGDLWLTTNDGLSRFSPLAGRFRNYDEDDGLQDREFNSGANFQGRSGRMFIGGTNGLNYFFPQDILDNTFVPPVRITSFKVLNREVKLDKPIWETDEIVLYPRDYLFSLEFAALDYAAPMKNRYAYKLEGLTDDWIETDARHRSVSFSTLSPGRYVLRVRGSSSDGQWSDQEARLVIHVRGPWWKSWWFLTLLALAFALLFFELNRTRIRRLATRIRTEEAMEQFFGKCSISPREREIVMLMLKGLSNKEIGEKLYIELSTVKIHVHHILKKLGVSNRTQLVRLFQNLKT